MGEIVVKLTIVVEHVDLYVLSFDCERAYIDSPCNCSEIELSADLFLAILEKFLHVTRSETRMTSWLSHSRHVSKDYLFTARGRKGRRQQQLRMEPWLHA